MCVVLFCLIIIRRGRERLVQQARCDVFPFYKTRCSQYNYKVYLFTYMGTNTGDLTVGSSAGETQEKGREEWGEDRLPVSAETSFFYPPHVPLQHRTVPPLVCRNLCVGATQLHW